MNSSPSIYEEVRPKNEPQFLVQVREMEKKIGFITPVKWTMVIFILLSHIIVITWSVYKLRYGGTVNWRTVLFAVGYLSVGGFGVTAGAHRLFAHRSYRAAPALRWLLGITFCIANAYRLYDWVRDHRVHHKFSEKSPDPHDASRGFFFSHMGWLMMKKHPDVIREGRKIDMSDISSDPAVQFISKYHYEMKLIFCVIIPICIPPLLWGESWGAATLAHLLAVHVVWHSIWSVNSFAHFYGARPYNPNINPSESKFVSLVALGEGWHNYHHTFPWDYKAAELPYVINVTTLLIDGFAKIGLVTHRKFASPQLVQATIQRNNSEKSQSE